MEAYSLSRTFLRFLTASSCELFVVVVVVVGVEVADSLIGERAPTTPNDERAILEMGEIRVVNARAEQHSIHRDTTMECEILFIISSVCEKEQRGRERGREQQYMCRTQHPSLLSIWRGSESLF
jgi:hypothetical protein